MNISQKNIYNYFQSIHKKYEFMNNIMSFGMHNLWRKDIIKNLKIQKGKTALDICCGTGAITTALGKELSEEGKVIGLDFSENMLKVAQESITDKKLKNVSLVKGNAMNLPFENEEFDYVIISFGLRNVENHKKAIEEMYRVVKKEGQVVCLETSRPKLAVYKDLYFFYLQKVIPILGKYIANNYAAYNWLQKSTMSFMDKDKLSNLFIKTGFKKIKVKSYCGGVAAMYQFKK
ncbi:demethylmenaquinone methyltransferase [Natronospora cellulosivora (SeqCode)]